MKSLLNKLRTLNKEQKMKFIKSLAPEELMMIYYDWRGLWARESQIEPPGDWTYWLVLAGRGFGKTRMASEWIRERVYSGEAKHLAFVAPRSADIRDVMIEGASGLLDVFPPNQRPIYEPSKRRVTFHTGAVAITYSGDEPDQLRGPNVDTVWCDELASCVDGETLIATEFGEIPIKDIKVGDMVHTRKGLRKVLVSCLTDDKADVYEVKFSDGRTLIGTANHPIYHADSGKFIPLITLVYRDKIDVFPYLLYPSQKPLKSQSIKKLESAKYVKKNFNVSLMSQRELAPVHVLTVSYLKSNTKVYNLKVEDTEEYYANGVLCHNCRLQKEIMDMIAFCLRIGSNPRCIITTTPRPTPTIKELAKQHNVHVTRGTTFENRDNLSPVFFDSIIGKYQGSRIGRQELMGEILEDNPKALWKSSEIDAHRTDKHPVLRRIVIGVDPAVTANKKSDETGIIAVGKGADDHYYVLDDKSCKETPAKWGKIVCGLYDKLEADKVVGEVNQGGDMVSHVIKTIDPLVNFKSVRATRGKKLRAEPVASLYEQGRVHHCGIFPDLETQMVEWNPEEDGSSPDRIDGLCWAIWELMGKGKRTLTSYNPEGITDFARPSPHLRDHLSSDPKNQT